MVHGTNGRAALARAPSGAAALLLLALASAACTTPGPKAETMSLEITPFLMFEGQAEEAMNFYVASFEHSRIESIERFGPGEAGEQGSVEQALFTLAGRRYRCIDSHIEHGFTFTPAVSLHVTCESRAEIDALFARLSEGGEVLMPLGDYGFSRRFGWCTDRFGVSWQLDLPRR